MRIGLAGVGRFGQLHAAVLAQLPGVHLAAIADISAERRNQVADRHGVPKRTATAEELFTDPDLDAFVVVTPDEQHGSQGLLAVQQVPARLRCTVFSVAYSLAMALFAGTGPLVCSWLLEQRGLVWGPTVYCLMFAIPALLALRQIRPALQRGG
jgi:hypothetical protein